MTGAEDCDEKLKNQSSKLKKSSKNQGPVLQDVNCDFDLGAFLEL